MPGPESAELVLRDATDSQNSEKLKESQHTLFYLTLSLTKKKNKKSSFIFENLFNDTG